MRFQTKTHWCGWGLCTKTKFPSRPEDVFVCAKVYPHRFSPAFFIWRAQISKPCVPGLSVCIPAGDLGTKIESTIKAYGITLESGIAQTSAAEIFLTIQIPTMVENIILKPMKFVFNVNPLTFYRLKCWNPSVVIVAYWQQLLAFSNYSSNLTARRKVGLKKLINVRECLRSFRRGVLPIRVFSPNA